MDDADGHRATLQLTPDEQLSLPEEYRRLLGLEGGGRVGIRFEGGEVRISSVAASLQALQTQAARIFAGSGYTVDKFLAERREEAALEEERWERLAREAANLRDE